MNYDTKVNVKHLQDFLALPEDSRRIANDMNPETFYAMHKDWIPGTEELTSLMNNNEQTILVLILIEAITFPDKIIHSRNYFYFTFPSSNSLANGYMIVEAIDKVEAIFKMKTEYGTHIWQECYTRFDFIHQVAKHNLYEIPFGYMPEE